MKIKCPECGKGYVLPDDGVKKFGSDFVMPCPACGRRIHVSIGNAHEHGGETACGAELKARIIKHIDDLPPMPQVAQKARSVIQDPRSSFSDLAKVIETDQGIVARVLKLANSPFYGVSGSVSTVQHASVVLGVDTLMELLTLACSSEMLGASLTGYGLASGDLWRHSLAVAHGSQLLARRHKPDLADDAFSAGLIHDVGKLILDKYVAASKTDFQEYFVKVAGSLREAEKAILGFDHAEIAAEVCNKWKIPERIVRAIRYHHKPGSSDGDVLAYVIHVADDMAKRSGFAAGNDPGRGEFDPEALRLLGLTSAEPDELLVRIAQYVEKVTAEI